MEIKRNNVEVKLLADSLSPYDNNVRLTTFQLRYPRIVHAELMTHRMFSRNAGSSRARPVTTVLKDDVFVPREFRKNKSGMQPGVELVNQEHAKNFWERAHEQAAYYSHRLGHKNELNVHKQWANRLTEPFAYIDVVVSATHWGNFFKLRCHDEAQLEIQDLAYAMRELYENNSPKVLGYGQWHLPYVTERDTKILGISTAKVISTARCARVSYKPFDEDNANVKKDIKLHDRLKESEHWSPFEHVATAHEGPLWHGNLYGFRSYRCEIQQINPKIEIPFNLTSKLNYGNLFPNSNKEILTYLEKKLNA